MLENRTRICEAKFGTLFRFNGAAFGVSAQLGTPAELVEFQKGSAECFGQHPARRSNASCGQSKWITPLTPP